MVGPDFLKKKYAELVGSSAVDRSVQDLSGSDQQKARKRIDAFLDRLTRVASDSGRFELFSRKIIDSFVTRLLTKDGKEDTERVTTLSRNIHGIDRLAAKRGGQEDEFLRLDSLSIDEVLK